jgi:hypothetical protein
VRNSTINDQRLPIRFLQQAFAVQLFAKELVLVLRDSSIDEHSIDAAEFGVTGCEAGAL